MLFGPTKYKGNLSEGILAEVFPVKDFNASFVAETQLDVMSFFEMKPAS